MTHSIHFNATTEQAYQGLNQSILEQAKQDNGYHSYAWAGYKQWEANGRQVIKGSRSSLIKIVLEFSEKNEKTGEVTKRTRVRELRVFNFEQTKEA